VAKLEQAPGGLTPISFSADELYQQSYYHMPSSESLAKMRRGRRPASLLCSAPRAIAGVGQMPTLAEYPRRGKLEFVRNKTDIARSWPSKRGTDKSPSRRGYEPVLRVQVSRRPAVVGALALSLQPILRARGSLTWLVTYSRNHRSPRHESAARASSSINARQLAPMHALVRFETPPCASFAIVVRLPLDDNGKSR
jgi:hypothetical protein